MRDDDVPADHHIPAAEVMQLGLGPEGARTARMRGRACRVTVASRGEMDLLGVMPALETAGVLITWKRADAMPSIRVVPWLPEALEQVEDRAAVLSVDHELLPVSVYSEIARLLTECVPDRAEVRRVRPDLEALAEQYVDTARTLLSLLKVPGFC